MDDSCYWNRNNRSSTEGFVEDFYYESTVNQSLTLSQQTKKKTEYISKKLQYGRQSLRQYLVSLSRISCFKVLHQLVCHVYYFIHYWTISNAGYGIMYYSGNLLHMLSQGYFQQGNEKSILYEANPECFLKRQVIMCRLGTKQFDQPCS